MDMKLDAHPQAKTLKGSLSIIKYPDKNPHHIPAH